MNSRSGLPAWRWRRGVEDTYHYRFWGQVVRWMAHQRHLAHKEGIRFFYNPELDDTIQIRPDGMIYMRLVGELGLDNLTVPTASALILHLLRG